MIKSLGSLEPVIALSRISPPTLLSATLVMQGWSHQTGSSLEATSALVRDSGLSRIYFTSRTALRSKARRDRRRNCRSTVAALPINAAHQDIQARLT